VNSKQRRQSGRVSDSPPISNDADTIFFEEYWDEWVDYRDGYRDLYRDRTLKKPILSNNKKINNKLNKLNLRRKQRKSLRI